MSSRDPLGDTGQAVADLAFRVFRQHGGAKYVAGGLIDVCYSQLQKWLGDGDIPSLRQVLRMVELAGPDDEFRLQLIDALSGMFAPDVERIAQVVESCTDVKSAARAVRQLGLPGCAGIAPPPRRRR